MENTKILAELIEIKSRITELGIKHVENQMPVALSDVGLVLRPFTGIDTAINIALKKLNEENTGSIPKQKILKS